MNKGQCAVAADQRKPPIQVFKTLTNPFKGGDQSVIEKVKFCEIPIIFRD
jgi:hypothetical protein